MSHILRCWKREQILNIDAEKIIAIGDNDNDAEMLLAVENSYAVKSASPIAKESAKFTLDRDNNEGAVARLIEILEENIK